MRRCRNGAGAGYGLQATGYSLQVKACVRWLKLILHEFGKLGTLHQPDFNIDDPVALTTCVAMAAYDWAAFR